MKKAAEQLKLAGISSENESTISRESIQDSNVAVKPAKQAKVHDVIVTLNNSNNLAAETGTAQRTVISIKGEAAAQSTLELKTADIKSSSSKVFHSDSTPGTDAPLAGTRKRLLYDNAPNLIQCLRAWGDQRICYLIIKRVFDICFSLFVVIVLLVPALILCLIIRFDSPGFPLYSQKRIGKIDRNGHSRTFTMWKFRSMCKGADSMLGNLSDKNEVKGPMFKMSQDPRVTRVGRFIRKHSIDELPQFLNVISGDMSVVGPRPPLPGEVEQYDEWAMQRLTVKPGITGPWQVGGRSNVDFDDMVRLDLGYIAKRSLHTDLVLVAQTIAVIFSGMGAV